MIYLKPYLSILKSNRTKQKQKSTQKNKLKLNSFKTKKHLHTEYEDELDESSKFSNEYELYNEEIPSKS